jgi:hypothetical protein
MSHLSARFSEIGATTTTRSIASSYSRYNYRLYSIVARIINVVKLEMFVERPHSLVANSPIRLHRAIALRVEPATYYALALPSILTWQGIYIYI